MIIKIKDGYLVNIGFGGVAHAKTYEDAVKINNANKLSMLIGLVISIIVVLGVIIYEIFEVY